VCSPPTLTLAIETVRPRWRGLVSGVVGGGGTTFGSVLASLSFLAATQLFPGCGLQRMGLGASCSSPAAYPYC